MAIVVRLHEPGVTTEVTSISPPEEAKWKCVNRVAHITVGTRDERTKPVYSNDLLAKWLDVGLGNGIQERVFEPKIVLDGAVKGVLSR
jgi:tRNA ligase